MIREQTDNKLSTYSSLTEHGIDIDGKAARYYQMLKTDTTPNNNVDLIKNKKPVAHFYGGNGFATGSYTPLLDNLSEQFDITSLSLRGCWYEKSHAKTHTREQDADLLIEFLEQTQSTPVIGIGHSQGATSTALACAKRPDLFSALYLIEPVTFTRQQLHLYNVMPRWFLKRHEPFKSALMKQATWQSVESYYHSLRQKNAFKRISDEHLSLYAKNSLEATEQGLSLIFSPEQELANYFGVPFIDDALRTINQYDSSYHLLIGKPSIFISNKVRQNWQKFVPHTAISTYGDYGHLLPVEAPQLCADRIIELHTIAQNN